MKKISNILSTIFAIGMLLSTFAGALSFVGYVVALIIGGPAAETLCLTIFNTYLPWVIRICSICVGCGLISMYLNKTSALTIKPTK